MNIVTSVGRGAELAASAVFVFAGVAKLADLDGTRLALGRVLFVQHRPAWWLATTVAITLGLVDVAAGTSLIVAPSRVVAISVLLITVGFIVAVISAQRRGVACGCFGTLFTGTTGRAEVRRAVAMCGLATITVVTRFVLPDGQVDVAVVVMAAAVSLSVLVGVSRRRSTGPVETLRLAMSGRAPDRGGWRRATPWARAAIVRMVRADGATAEVAGHPDLGRPSWRSARVRTRRVGALTVASIVVRAPGGTMQALWRVDAPIAVVGYTRRGVILPVSARRNG